MERPPPVVDLKESNVNKRASIGREKSSAFNDLTVFKNADTKLQEILNKSKDFKNFNTTQQVQFLIDAQNYIEVNSIQGIYPKSNNLSILKWINNGLLQYVNKEKAFNSTLTQSTNLIVSVQNEGLSNHFAFTQPANLVVGLQNEDSSYNSAFTQATNLLGSVQNQDASDATWFINGSPILPRLLIQMVIIMQMYKLILLFPRK